MLSPPNLNKAAKLLNQNYASMEIKPLELRLFKNKNNQLLKIATDPIHSLSMGHIFYAFMNADAFPPAC